MADLTVTVNANASGVSQAILEQARKAEAAIKKVPLRIQTSSLGGGFKTLTADVDRFDKSVSRMAAVISTFGQAAAVVFGIQNAFAAMVKTAINVEKQLNDINSIFNVTEGTLASFSNGLFKVAKETITTFDEVAKAAGEFARQGLGVEETLKRTRDAMALVKISGGDAASAVQSITAALNTFNNELLDSTKLVNTLTNVDANFAVSANDLAESLKRAGASAKDAGVGYKELISLTTSLQQSTARGGSVIGNSLKSIFTRVTRTDTLDLLDDLGVKTRNLEGEVRPAVEILKELSSVFNLLSDSQKSQVKESVAGVYQINALSALLSDLSSKTSVYDGALSKANETTDSASARLKILAETTSATLNTAQANLTKLGAAIGKATVTDGINTAVTGLNKIFETLENADDTDIVSRIFKGALKGTGDFIGTGGGILASKAAVNIGRLAIEGVKDQLVAATTLSRTSEKRLHLEEQIKQVLMSQDPVLMKQLNSAKSLEDAYKLIFKQLQANTAAMIKQQSYISNVATFGLKNNISPVAKPGKTLAGGHIPSLFAERTAIQKGIGGASRGSKPVVIPNFNLERGKRETVIANTSEYVVPNFANSGASAIFNQDMIKRMGLPKGSKKIMAGGHIPNFAQQNYVYDDVDSEISGYIGADFPGRRNAIKRQGVIPIRPDEIIDLLYDAKSPIRITDPSIALKQKLLEEAPELLSKVIISSPKTPLINKYEETKLGAGLSPSVDIKDILGKDNSKASPIKKILKYGQENFGDSFFLKPFIGAQGDAVLSKNALSQRQRLGSENAYGGFFLQKGIENPSDVGDEFRVHVAKTGGKARVLGGVGSKFRDDKGKLYANPDFFQNRSSKSGLSAYLSREIAASQAKRLVQSLPGEYEGTVAGVDVMGTGNKGIKLLAQYASEKLGLPFFKGGGAIEYNFSQKELVNGQGGASGALSRSDVLVASDKNLRKQSKFYVNDFVKRGNIVASLSGEEQTSSFKSLYKDLTKLKDYDEDAFYKIAKRLNATGSFGIDIGKGRNRRSLDKSSGAKYLSQLGYAGGFIPNFALFSGRKAAGFVPEFISPLDNQLRGVLNAPKNLFKSKGGTIEEIIRNTNNGRSGAYLEDLINFDDLFNSYPSLAESNIGTNVKTSTGLFTPSIIPGFGEIDIRKGLKRSDAGNTLIHELQHAVQNIEGSFPEDDAIYKKFEKDRKAAKRSGADLTGLRKRYKLINSELEANAASSLFRGRTEGRSQLSLGEFFKVFINKSRKENLAGGYIPNFANPLKPAIEREAVALNNLGYSKSDIFKSLRVQASPKLKNPDNPRGLAVFNTLQGQNNINKAMSDHSGENLMKGGMIPNFAKIDPNILSSLSKTGVLGSADFSTVLSSVTRSGSGLSSAEYDKEARKTLGLLNKESRALEQRIRNTEEGSALQKQYKKSLNLTYQAQEIILKETKRTASVSQSAEGILARTQTIDRKKELRNVKKAERLNGIAESGAIAPKESLSSRLSQKAFMLSFAIPVGTQIANQVFNKGEDTESSRFLDSASQYGSIAAAATSFGTPGLIAAGAIGAYGLYDSFQKSRETFTGQFGAKKRLEETSKDVQTNESSINSIKGGLVNISEARESGKASAEDIRAAFDQIIQNISSVTDSAASGAISKIVTSMESTEEKINKIKQIELKLSKEGNIKANAAGLDTFLDSISKDEKSLKTFGDKNDLASLVIGSLDLDNLPDNIVKNLDSDRYKMNAGDLTSILFSDLDLSKVNDISNKYNVDLSTVNEIVKKKIKERVEIMNSVDAGIIQLQEASAKSRKKNLTTISSTIDSISTQRSLQKSNELTSFTDSVQNSKAPDFLKIALTGQAQSAQIGTSLGDFKLDAGKKVLDELRGVDVNSSNRSNLDSTISKLSDALLKGDVLGTESVISQAALGGFSKEADLTLNQILQGVNKQNIISSEELKLTRENTSKALRSSLNNGYLGFGQKLQDSQGFFDYGASFGTQRGLDQNISDTAKKGTSDSKVVNDARAAQTARDQLASAEEELKRLTFTKQLGGQDLKDNRALLAASTSKDPNAFLNTQLEIAARKEKEAQKLSERGSSLDTVVRGTAVLRSQDTVRGFQSTTSPQFNKVFKKELEDLNTVMSTGDPNKIKDFISKTKFNPNKTNNIFSDTANRQTVGKDVQSIQDIFKEITDTILNEDNITGTVGARANEIVGNTGVDVNLALLGTMNESLGTMISSEETTATNTQKMVELLSAANQIRITQNEADKINQTTGKAQNEAADAQATLKLAQENNIKKFNALAEKPEFKKLSKSVQTAISGGVREGKPIDEILKNLPNKERTIVAENTTLNNETKSFAAAATASILNDLSSLFGGGYGKGVLEDVLTQPSLKTIPGAKDEATTFLSQNPNIAKLLSSPSQDIASLQRTAQEKSIAAQEAIRNSGGSALNRDEILLSTMARAIGQNGNTPISGFDSKSASLGNTSFSPYLEEFKKSTSGITSKSLPSEIEASQLSGNKVIESFMNNSLDQARAGLGLKDLQNIGPSASQSLRQFSSADSEGGQSITESEFKEFAKSFIESINRAVEANKKDTESTTKSPEVSSTKSIDNLTQALAQGAEVTTRNVVEVKVEATKNSAMSDEILASIKTAVSDAFAARETQQSLVFGNKTPGINIG